MFERVFVFKISGPTLEFLEPRVERLPSFSRFMKEGMRSRPTGPLQPSPALSYSCLHTGKNPDKTGLFDFFRFPAGSYERVPYSSDLLHEVTFYQRLSAGGKKVELLNVPLTFPLPELDGFVVSGDGLTFLRGRKIMVAGTALLFRHRRISDIRQSAISRTLTRTSPSGAVPPRLRS